MFDKVCVGGVMNRVVWEALLSRWDSAEDFRELEGELETSGGTVSSKAARLERLAKVKEQEEEQKEWGWGSDQEKKGTRQGGSGKSIHVGPVQTPERSSAFVLGNE